MHFSLPDCCVLLDVTKEAVNKITIAKPFNCLEKRTTGKQSALVFPRSSVAAKHFLVITFIRQNFRSINVISKKFYMHGCFF